MLFIICVWSWVFISTKPSVYVFLCVLCFLWMLLGLSSTGPDGWVYYLVVLCPGAAEGS